MMHPNMVIRLETFRRSGEHGSRLRCWRGLGQIHNVLGRHTDRGPRRRVQYRVYGPAFRTPDNIVVVVCIQAFGSRSGFGRCYVVRFGLRGSVLRRFTTTVRTGIHFLASLANITSLPATSSSSISSSVTPSSRGSSKSRVQGMSRATRAETILRFLGVSFFTLGESPTRLSRSSLDSTLSMGQLSRVKCLGGMDEWPLVQTSYIVR